MIKTARLATLLLSGALLSNGGQTTDAPPTFLRQDMGLSDRQVAEISRGKAIAKVLPSSKPEEIFVFGAVFIKSTPNEYVRTAFDIGRLGRSPGYLAAKRFSDPPTLSDLEGFTLGEEDIQSLRFCRPGHCGVQLPAATIHELQNLGGANLGLQMNDIVRKMALDLVKRCRQGGSRLLGVYHDAESPYDLDANLPVMLDDLATLPISVPELKRYLWDHPSATPSNFKSLFYWEKINFGLKPTLRLNHAIAYHSVGPRGAVQVVAVQQLYASHYFRLALDLTLCLAETERTNAKGFYLISLRGSTQEGLSGWVGSLVRRIAVHRVSAAEEALMNIKISLEQSR
jgi:hypothetical protein